MKIYDCTTFYSEHMMMDLRFNILNEHVAKFIVIESTYSHSGTKKKLNFNINDYPKFKDKIIYLVIDEEPQDIIPLIGKENNPSNKRQNSIKRIELSYNFMSKAITDADDSDLIILSDNDEIPNLNSEKFKSSKKDYFIFKQLLFYYKFNYLHEAMPWFGSKACKKKRLKSFSSLRNLKNKKYPFWRFDTYFNKNKQVNIDIIDNGGWHFTNIKSPKDLFEKLSNFGHHDEFDESGVSIDFLKEKIDKGEVFYNHELDKSNLNKWNDSFKLTKVDLEILPTFLQENKKKYIEWLV
jgi:beta-1,4-mannosyl-glycoprotein beta-1,4-N-acetylglucosaminyltransferase